MIDEEIDYCVMCHKPVYGTTMCDECRADVIKRADALCEFDKKLEDNFDMDLTGRRRTMTVRALINELLSFEPSDWVIIDGEKLRVSSEVCDSFILMTKDGNAYSTRPSNRNKDRHSWTI